MKDLRQKPSSLHWHTQQQGRQRTPWLAVTCLVSCFFTGSKFASSVLLSSSPALLLVFVTSRTWTASHGFTGLCSKPAVREAPAEPCQRACHAAHAVPSKQPGWLMQPSCLVRQADKCRLFISPCNCSGDKCSPGALWWTLSLAGLPDVAAIVVPFPQRKAPRTSVRGTNAW